MNTIYAAGPDAEWSEDLDWTQEQQDDLWTRLEDEVLYEAEKIVSYVDVNYRDAYAKPTSAIP